MSLVSFHRSPKRLLIALTIAIVVSFFLLRPDGPSSAKWQPVLYNPNRLNWAKRPEKYPVPAASMARLPSAPPQQLRRIQHDFSTDEPNPELLKLQETRRKAVMEAFKKSWDGYRTYAWGYDELRPETLQGVDTFSGWGATLVDSLDSLWILGLKSEFKKAVKAVKKIDWSRPNGRGCSLFETNIRYLGGLLSAYDLSGEKVLLDKALELGHMLYAAFDNEHRMPVNAFDFEAAWYSNLHPSSREISAAVGTLSLEFTRLAQFTNESKFYDAIDRIKEHLRRTQEMSYLPGMWPMYIDLSDGFTMHDTSFTMGAQADSLYEYLPKMYALLGGLDDTYAEMHRSAMETAKKHLLFRPMIPDNSDILFAGDVLSNGHIVELQPDSQHLTCFTGGMYALGGKLLGIEDHVAIGGRLARGCAWSYSSTYSGIMPEVATHVPCKEPDLGACEWNYTLWENKAGLNSQKIPKGFTSIRDRRYQLRPEAIESVFIMYRITGDREWLDTAWAMWESISNATQLEHSFSSIGDVLSRGVRNHINVMESFWMAETLKYFYLIFSSPDVISLDDYVFNTEAHPFKIPKPV